LLSLFYSYKNATSENEDITTTEELDFLKMAGTKFLVEIIENKPLNLEEKNSIESKNYFPNGFERAVFKASLNKNNFDEITKIASGGELSRFMLALKNVPPSMNLVNQVVLAMAALRPASAALAFG
jgi:DNA repair ATPase RecN